MKEHSYFKKENKMKKAIYAIDYDEVVIFKERKACLEYIDVLVDGLFVKELYSPQLKFRGSSNQRIIQMKTVREKINEKTDER